MMMTLSQAHALLPGSRLVGDGSVAIARVHTDTRTLQAGDLFVALKGERFDAHDFLPQAGSAGAVAVIAQRGVAEAGLSGLLVADSRQALGELAAAWRAQFDLPLIAVTGSNGKTTVTQMIASILRAWHGAAAFATEGNFNNDIGVPLTLLRLNRSGVGQHRAGVVELGMNHPGEIALLARWTAPTVALVNNAQREHQEFMQSVEAVARENGAVIEALPADGAAVFPFDDAAHTPIWRQLAGSRRLLGFALQGPADVTGAATWAVDHWVLSLHTPAGEAAARVRVAGWHNVKNALAATACALAAGCPLDAVVRGLEAFEPVKGRSQVQRIRQDERDVTLIDDTYNANPDSMRAAIDVLVTLPGPRWLVMGDMGEVGDQGPAFHREVGAHAAAQGVEFLWAVGAASAHAVEAYRDAGGATARHFNAVADAIAAVQQAQAPAAGAVVVKGSRFMKMEQVVAALKGAAHAG